MARVLEGEAWPGALGAMGSASTGCFLKFEGLLDVWVEGKGARRKPDAQNLKRVGLRGGLFEWQDRNYSSRTAIRRGTPIF